MATTSQQPHYDVIVGGAGPAGIAAAIAASRAGASVALIEPQNALGGVWTSGLLSLILDSGNKPGIMDEIRSHLRQRSAIADHRDLYDAEAMKIVLDEMCEAAGIDILLHSKISEAVVTEASITHVILECKEGRRSLSAHCFIDCTGDGDLAARAGCDFDLGRDEDGLTQPLSLMALLAGVPKHIREQKGKGTASCLPKLAFLDMLRESGFEPSYRHPSLFSLPNGLCALMANHQYEFSSLTSADLTKATLQARREINHTVEAMRRMPGGWDQVQLVSTAAQIGIREGRRIHGLYRITLEDVISGARHPDAIARCTYGIDVHSPSLKEGGSISNPENVRSLPYDIPLRALIARDCENLLMAGRCISGDFDAHSSYRVTGNAVATGEAAGTAAALCADRKRSPKELPFEDVLNQLQKLRGERVPCVPI
ncbi:FAD-dependent oxidoreductase [Kiritimatiellota bacterium B12222]|nr:FAD-dependent oxidoreductase [Kiritimatiellota bacterium B12222]